MGRADGADGPARPNKSRNGHKFNKTKEQSLRLAFVDAYYSPFDHKLVGAKVQREIHY